MSERFVIDPSHSGVEALSSIDLRACSYRWRNRLPDDAPLTVSCSEQLIDMTRADIAREVVIVEGSASERLAAADSILNDLFVHRHLMVSTVSEPVAEGWVTIG